MPTGRNPLLPCQSLNLSASSVNDSFCRFRSICFYTSYRFFSSANYDVELFHKASAAQGVVEAGLQTQKDEYLTITLKWSTPRSTAGDLHNTTSVSRVTPIDVNSRHSSCLTNFLLNDRSVMLEMPTPSKSRAGGASHKVLSHMLTSHAGEIFIHTLNISKSVLEDPPNIFDGNLKSLNKATKSILNLVLISFCSSWRTSDRLPSG